MEEVKVRELPEKEQVNSSDYIIVEDEDGTKKSLVKNFRSLILSSLYFTDINELKTSSRNLKVGDICQTLGYYEEGDGGAAFYRITYNPGAVEDGRFIHYLSYSDTLRAELIVENTMNIQQLGAKGDGKHDDSDAIQAAIDHGTQRIIEFAHNKTYLIKKSININKSNITIKGNGSTISPQYINGLNISATSDGATPVRDIIIDDLNFNCSLAISAIYAYKVLNMHINKMVINGITDKGIRLINSVFVNITNCEFNNASTGSAIVLEGTNKTSNPALSCRSININNCTFANFTKAIYILSTGNNADTGANVAVSIINCMYNSTVADSTSIYIAAPIQSVTIDSNSSEGTDTFLYFGGASKGNVSCKDISCLSTKKVFNIGTAYGVLHLDGYVSADSSSVMFENMAGKLHSNIAWDTMPTNASFTNAPTGELFDVIDPLLYSDKSGFSIADGKLTLRSARNMNVNWSSTVSNLKEITNGIKGQLLFLRSSTGKAIESSNNKIELKDSYVTLGAYNGILLKYNGLKWVQLTTDGTESGSSNPSAVTQARSVYDIWLELGNIGTAADFMNTLKGTSITDVSASSNGKNVTFTFFFSNNTSKNVSITLS